MRVNRYRDSWRLLCLFVFLFVLHLALFPADFFDRRFVIGHDTISYTNVPGISEGISLSNFSSDLRTPGYSLFLFFTTLGEIPNRHVISHIFCGQSVFGTGPDCEKLDTREGGAVVVRADPLIYGFSKRSEELFQRTIVITRWLFVLSSVFLYWSLSRLFNPIISLSAVLFVILFIPLKSYPSGFDFLQTEGLYPTLFFFYVGCLIMYISGGKDSWVTLSSGLAVAIFLVRPAFLYVPVIHLVLIIVYFTASRRTLRIPLTNSFIIAGPIIWVFFFSPINFFSVANHVSQLARVAMFSDSNTINCVKDEDVKTTLGAYIKAVNSSMTDQGANIRNDLDRYYFVSATNIYRLDLPSHPIYNHAEIRPLLNSSGVIPVELIGRLAQQATTCNVLRQVQLMVLIVKMTLGLTPPLTSHAPRNFFDYPYALYLSFLAICVALAMQYRERTYSLSLLIVLSVGIYCALMLIVAIKQGGESRYMSVVEPLYVLGTAIACSYLLQMASNAGLLFARAIATRLRRFDPVVLRWNAIFLALALFALNFFIPTSGLDIRLATYGGNCGAPPGNATKHVVTICSGRADCEYIVDVVTLRDPASGCSKDFVVEYSCAPDTEVLRKEVPAEAGLRSKLVLSCEPPALN